MMIPVQVCFRAWFRPTCVDRLESRDFAYRPLNKPRLKSTLDNRIMSRRRFLRQQRNPCCSLRRFGSATPGEGPDQKSNDSTMGQT